MSDKEAAPRVRTHPEARTTRRLINVAENIIAHPGQESTNKEELLAAAEYALRWFEAWEVHAPDECSFGGEHAVMQNLRRAVRLAREEAS